MSIPGGIDTQFKSGHDKRLFIFQGTRLFEQGGCRGELRDNPQRVRARLQRGGDAGDDAAGVVLRQAAFDLVYRLFRRIARDKVDAAQVRVARNLDFRALDKDVFAGGDGAVGGFREGVGDETDACAAAFLHAKHFHADGRKGITHFLGEHHVEGELVYRRVEVRALADPAAGDARGVLPHARENAITVAHCLADDAVVLVDNGQQRVVLDFAAFVHNALRDVLIAEGLFRGGYLGDVVVVYVLGEEVGRQPYLPIFSRCHNVQFLISKQFSEGSVPIARSVPSRPRG